MRTLVIDSATEACSVALFEDDGLIGSDYRVLGRGHAELLIPMVAALPGKGKADRIVVSLGPGSFTGVRVGLAAARGLALAWKAEALGYPTLALIAAMAQAERAAQNVTVVMTGGHGEWFVQPFDADGAALADLESLSPDDAARLVTSPLVAGTQATALVTARGNGDALSLLPDARQFALLPKHFLTPDLTPLYGRPPDARLPGARLVEGAA
jgi:tRNA threonylcarbamoyl adenosine modification protein YeaZ